MYSQYEEEAYILAAFGEERGRFLDLGAYHPTDKSNTRALFERGWYGVMVEPSPMPFDTLLREYGKNENMVLICAAVGIEKGLAYVFASADAVSTTDTATHELWSKDGGYYGAFLISQITLEQISNQFGGFDFVNIDVEGTSVDILLRMLALNWEPKCICVEHDNRLPEAAQAATAKGYKLVYANGTNAVFVR